VAIALQFHKIDDALHRLAVAHFLAAHARQEQHLGDRIGTDSGMTTGQQVVEHRHVRKQLAVLEGSGKPKLRDVVRQPAGDILAAKADCAVAAVESADAVEHAGLTGAVRPDQREQLARVDSERNAVKHDQPTEP
jgi:hypothetical protein